MAGLHTPERLPGEPMAAYRQRRARSQAVVRIATEGPKQAPYIPLPGLPPPNWVHWWLGQHRTDQKRRERRDLVAGLGRRQFLKQLKALRRAHAGVRELTGGAS